MKANGGGRKSVRQQFQIERERRRVGGRMPWYTKRRPGLHVGTGPHVNETWCVISRAKCDLAELARIAALFLEFTFLMACRSVLKHD